MLPPRTSVELGERLGMFDTSTGKLHSDAATWNLIAKQDAAELNHVKFEIAHGGGLSPRAGRERRAALPPDLFSRGAAIRDLPATPSGAIGRAAATGASDKVVDQLSDPNPRPGSATLVSFSGRLEEDAGLQLVLGEPAAGDDDARPSWDPVSRVLTVLLPKGEMTTVPLSSYLLVDDLKLMGQWQWLRQFVELLTVVDPDRAQLIPGADVDRIAHVLQRAVEGGHWLLTPPRLLTLVHAVQQPIGRPEFAALDVEHDRRRVRSRSAADEADLPPARSDGARDHRVAEVRSLRRVPDGRPQGPWRQHGQGRHLGNMGRGHRRPGRGPEARSRA